MSSKSYSCQLKGVFRLQLRFVIGSHGIYIITRFYSYGLGDSFRKSFTPIDDNIMYLLFLACITSKDELSMRNLCKAHYDIGWDKEIGLIRKPDENLDN